jgi:hypothetical protein
VEEDEEKDGDDGVVARELDVDGDADSDGGEDESEVTLRAGWAFTAAGSA